MIKARDSFGYLSYKTSRLIVNGLTALFVEHGVDITVEQWRVLMPLHQYDGLPQGVIGEALLQEKTGISRLAAGLERHGYIRRESDEEDRRLKRLFITDAGREVVEKTMPLVKALMVEAEKGIPEDQVQLAKNVMHRVLENLLGHPDPAVACCEDEDED